MTPEEIYERGLYADSVSRTAAVLVNKGEQLDRERSIIAQNAGTTAATIYVGLLSNGYVSDFDPEVYNRLRTEVFNGTLALAGAESIVENFEGNTSDVVVAPTSGSTGSSKPNGDLEIRAGKHAGKTIAQVAEEDESYLDWAAKNLKNDFLRGKIEEFLAA
jgi:hypothetical protein